MRTSFAALLLMLLLSMEDACGGRVKNALFGGIFGDSRKIDGDIHTVGSSGTVLVGFHTAGQVKIEPGQPADFPSSSSTNGAAPVATGELGFFGEMMRFTCCTEDFTTKIVGPQV